MAIQSTKLSITKVKIRELKYTTLSLQQIACYRYNLTNITIPQTKYAIANKNIKISYYKTKYAQA